MAMLEPRLKFLSPKGLYRLIPLVVQVSLGFPTLGRRVTSSPIRLQSSMWWFGNPPFLVSDGYIVAPMARGSRAHLVEVGPQSCILVTRYAQAGVHGKS